MNTRNSFEQMFKRIQSATNCRTQAQLAELLGIKQSSISDAKKRSHVPAEWLLKLYRAKGLNPEWLVSGSEPMYLKDAATDQRLAHIELTSPAKACPIFKSSGMRPDADKELFELDSQLILPSHLQRESVAMFIVDGHAMSPTIKSGAIVGVDTGCKMIRSGEIYAFDIAREGFTVRRVFYSPSERTLILRADLYQEQEQTLSVESADFDVLGLVRFVLQEL